MCALKLLICKSKFCVKINVLLSISGLHNLRKKNCSKTQKFTALHAQEMHKRSQKKYLREICPNYAQKILSFRGNPNK